MISRWIDWASKNVILNVVIVIIYYLLVVLPHEIVGGIIAGMFREHGRPFYDKILLIVFSAILMIFIITLSKRIYHHTNRKIVLFYLLLTCFFAFLCYEYLFVVNVEAIHFVQYGVLAILLFPLFRNYTYVLIWTTVAGVIDEFYQYDILAPGKTEYYDFNDVIIDMVGAGFGMVAIRVYDPEIFRFDFSHFLKSLHSKLIFLFLGVVSILFVVGLFTYYPEEGSIFFLQAKPIPWFWFELPPEVVFHVIPPWEGVGLIVALLLFYKWIENKSPLLSKI